jgi:chemotaxis methyl-accepting protein methylase
MPSRPFPRIRQDLDTAPPAAWEPELLPLRELYEAALRDEGLAPVAPDTQLLSRRIELLGLDAAAYARRCAEIPHERLTLLDAVRRRPARWFGGHALTDLVERVLPVAARRRRRTERPGFRAWVMATATGEKAWSLALALHRSLPERERWDATVLATDFSPAALAEGIVGVYATARTTALGVERRRQGFVPMARNAAWATRPELRRMVHFAWLSPGAPWPLRDRFDAVVCGDLLALLTPSARAAAMESLTLLLRPRGTLYTDPTDEFPELDLHFPRRRAPGVRSR